MKEIDGTDNWWQEWDIKKHLSHSDRCIKYNQVYRRMVPHSTLRPVGDVKISGSFTSITRTIGTEFSSASSPGLWSLRKHKKWDEHLHPDVMHKTCQLLRLLDLPRFPWVYFFYPAFCLSITDANLSAVSLFCDVFWQHYLNRYISKD